jgi:hypothetical protein
MTAATTTLIHRHIPVHGMPASLSFGFIQSVLTEIKCLLVSKTFAFLAMPVAVLVSSFQPARFHRGGIATVCDAVYRPQEEHAMRSAIDHARVLGALALTVWLGAAGAAEPDNAAAAAPVPSVPSVLFMADAQIHNVFGGQVFQTIRIADIVSHVAQRHPEINLLSRYAVQDFIERGEQMAPAAAPPMMVMLGDAANAACTNEYDRFMATATTGNPDRIVLIAHGNHDSYLMGTINYYQPDPAHIDYGKFANADFPVDETWWPPAAAPTWRTRKGWKPLCYQDIASKSVPMHKTQWMAKYLASLARPLADGSPQLALEKGETVGNETWFDGRGKPGTMLGNLSYRVQGAWIRPVRGRRLEETYNSFLVQAVDVGQTHRLILVDTAACADFDAAWTRRLPRYGRQNAGFIACMREPQRNAIQHLADESRGSGRKLVFAGHHPLKDMQGNDRAEFIRLMERTSGKDWTYVSAHTHAPKTEVPLDHGAKEINIGSTTDWPMSAYRLQFGPTVSATAISGLVPTMTYGAPDVYKSGPELCRHLAAAEKLADLDPGADDAWYASPGKLDDYNACKRGVWRDWASYQQRLSAAVLRIDQRMADPSFKRRALDIMSAASLSEYYTVWHDVPAPEHTLSR